jgi:hypothetical protein
MAEAIVGASPTPTPTSTPVPAAVNKAPTPVDTSADVDLSDIDLPGEADAVVDPKADKKEDKAAKAASAKKKFKLKVDGKEEDFEFDPTNEEELIKQLQLSRVGHKRMQSEAELRKGIDELVTLLRTDPLKVIADPRLNIPDETRKKMAQAIIDNEIEELSKTPEQKEKERLQKDYERLKQEVENEKKAREQAEMAKLTQEQRQSLDTEISDAIESSGLPKNARTVRYMAEALSFCLQNNLDLNAKDLVPFIKKQTLTEFKEMISALPDDEFESWLGKDQISRLRKRSIARRNAAVDPATAIKPTGSEAPKQEQAPRVSMKAFFGSLGK